MLSCPLKRHVFLASFLLSQISPLFIDSSWGMLTDEQLKELNRSQHPIEKEENSDQKRKKKFYLLQGITAFETQDWNTAAEIFNHLHNNGALIPWAYLEHMKAENSATIILPQRNQDFFADVDLPQAGKDLSNSYLKASLAWIDYQTAKNEGDKKKDF